MPPQLRRKNAVNFTYQLEDRFSAGIKTLLASNATLTKSFKDSHKIIREQIKLSRTSLLDYQRLLKSINRETLSFGVRSKQSFIGAATGLNKLTRQAEAATRAVINLKRVGATLPMTAGGGVAPPMGGAPVGRGSYGAVGAAGAAGLAAGGASRGFGRGRSFSGITSGFVGYGSLFTATSVARTGFVNFLEREKAEQAVRSRTYATSETPRRDFRQYSSLADRLSTQYPERPHEAWDAILSAQKAGLTRKQVISVVPAASKFGVANRSQFDIATNTEHLAAWNSALNPLNKKGKKTFSVRQISNLITAAAEIAPWTADEVNKFGSSSRAFAKTAGLGYMPDVLTMGAINQRKIKNPFFVGTGLKNYANLISKIPTNKARTDRFREIFGDRLEDFYDLTTGQKRGWAAYKGVHQYLNAPGNEAKKAAWLNEGTIRSKFFQVPYINAKWGDIESARNQIIKGANENRVNQLYDAQMGTLSNRLVKMVGSLEVVLQNSLSGASPVLGGVASGVTAVSETLGKFEKTLRYTTFTLAGLGVSLGGFLGYKGVKAIGGLAGGALSRSFWGASSALDRNTKAGFFARNTAQFTHFFGGHFSDITGIQSPYSRKTAALAGIKEKYHAKREFLASMQARGIALGNMVDRSTSYMNKETMGVVSGRSGKTPEEIRRIINKAGAVPTQKYMMGSLTDGGLYKAREASIPFILQGLGLKDLPSERKRIRTLQAFSSAGMVEKMGKKEQRKAIKMRKKWERDYKLLYKDSMHPSMKANDKIARAMFNQAIKDGTYMSPLRYRWRELGTQEGVNRWKVGWNRAQLAGSVGWAGVRGSFDKGFGAINQSALSAMNWVKRPHLNVGPGAGIGAAAVLGLGGMALSNWIAPESMSQSQRNIKSIFDNIGKIGTAGMFASMFVPGLLIPSLLLSGGAFFASSLYSASTRLTNENIEQIDPTQHEVRIILDDTGREVGAVKMTRSGKVSVTGMEGDTATSHHISLAL